MALQEHNQATVLAQQAQAQATLNSQNASLAARTQPVADRPTRDPGATSTPATAPPPSRAGVPSSLPAAVPSTIVTATATPTPMAPAVPVAAPTPTGNAFPVRPAIEPLTPMILSRAGSRGGSVSATATTTPTNGSMPMSRPISGPDPTILPSRTHAPNVTNFNNDTTAPAADETPPSMPVAEDVDGNGNVNDGVVVDGDDDVIMLDAESHSNPPLPGALSSHTLPISRPEQIPNPAVTNRCPLPDPTTTNSTASTAKPSPASDPSTRENRENNPPDEDVSMIS